MEGDFVGNIHTNWISNKSFAAFNIPDDKCIVILTSKRGKILLIKREGKTLNENFMKFESVFHLQGLEVPNDDISLK